MVNGRGGEQENEVEVLMNAFKSTSEDNGDEDETESEGEVDSGDTNTVTTVQQVYP